MTCQTRSGPRFPRARSVAMAIGSVVFAAACGEGSARIAGSTVSASAGIAITESSAPRWADSGGWTISPSALVDIGVTDGPAEYQLSRVEGVLRLGDGRIVAAPRTSASTTRAANICVRSEGREARAGSALRRPSRAKIWKITSSR
jgi:hypothetical protein